MIKTCSPACVSKAFSGHQILSSKSHRDNFPESTAKGFLVKKGCFAHTTAPTPLTYTTQQHLHRSPTPHHSTYTTHIHHTTAHTPLTYTTPQHIHRSHSPHHSTYIAHIHHTTAPTSLAYIKRHNLHLQRSLTSRHSTYIAHLHHTTVFTPLAYTPQRLFYFSLISKARVGLATVGMHPCVSERSRCGAVRFLEWLR